MLCSSAAPRRADGVFTDSSVRGDSSLRGHRLDCDLSRLFDVGVEADGVVAKI